MSHCLLIEPYYVGSHRQLVDLLAQEFPGLEPVTLPGKKWHWKARTAALYLSQHIPRSDCYRVLFASSVLNLAELVALRPDLVPLQKILYFHENQLVYPVREHKERDFQYGYNQILSCLVADIVLFNSQYNMDSFLSSIASFLKLIPDHRPRLLAEQIHPKCHVLHFPIVFPLSRSEEDLDSQSGSIASCKKARIEEGLEGVSAAVLRPSMTCRTESCGPHANDKLLLDKNNCSTNLYGQLNTIEKDMPISCSSSTSLDDGSDVIKNYVPTSRSIQMVDHRPNVAMADNGEGSIHVPEVRLEDEISSNHLRQESISNESIRSNVLSEPSSNTGTDIRCQTEFNNVSRTPALHIVWPHRWEHDKGPEVFLQTVQRLHNEGLDFCLSVLGETFTDVPAIFEETRVLLGNKIRHWGYQPSKQDYYNVLRSCDCVVSTAQHEFFGVAMLEAVHLGCYPLCPNRLVYPEIFPKECLYNTDQQLYKRLRNYCRNPHLLRNHPFQFATVKFSWTELKEEFRNFLKKTI